MELTNNILLEMVEDVFQKRWKKVFEKDVFEIPFRSESDFQLCLASALETACDGYVVCTEYAIKGFRHRSDIAMISPDKKCIIELKYSVVDGNCRYIAGTECQVDKSYLDDIGLVKQIINTEVGRYFVDKTENKFEKGYCVFLTNDMRLKSPLEAVSDAYQEIQQNIKDIPSFNVYIKEILK